jgi:hypothetical protein
LWATWWSQRSFLAIAQGGIIFCVKFVIFLWSEAEFSS